MSNTFLSIWLFSISIVLFCILISRYYELKRNSSFREDVYLYLTFIKDRLKHNQKIYVIVTKSLYSNIDENHSQIISKIPCWIFEDKEKAYRFIDQYVEQHYTKSNIDSAKAIFKVQEVKVGDYIADEFTDIEPPLGARK